MENLAYKDERRFEILNGKIVNMSPGAVANHNRIVVNIVRIFSSFFRGKPCDVFTDGLDVHFSKKDIFIPDVMIICNKGIIKNDGIHGAPDLVVEVLSPSTAQNDRGYKKDTYEKYGVKEYWLVDIKNKSIEIYLLQNEKYILDNIYSYDEDEKNESQKFQVSSFPELTVTLSEVFEKI